MAERNDKPFFSIIIPVYNKELHIARSIRSVINQTFSDFELIIVCDPSSDNSNMEVARFNDPRIRVFNREAPGPGGYAARNLGILESTAKWIAFLDADDEYELDYLEKANSQIEENQGCDLFLFAHKIIRDDQEELRCPPKSAQNKIINKKDSLSFLFTGGSIHTNSIIVSKEIANKSGGFPADKGVLRGGDVDTWVRFIVFSKSVFSSYIISSRYHIDNSGVVSNKKSLSTKLSVYNTAKNISRCPTKYNVDSGSLNIIKQISNVKVIALLLQRKKNGLPYITLFRAIFFCNLRFSDYLKLIYIFAIPKKMLKSVILN